MVKYGLRLMICWLAGMSLSAQPRIAISYPTDEAKVVFGENIRGTLAGSSGKAHVHILVKPLRDPNYYVQQPPSDAASGKWETVFYCGNKEGGGIGERFRSEERRVGKECRSRWS